MFKNDNLNAGFRNKYLFAIMLLRLPMRAKLKEILRQVRASNSYLGWVKRNKTVKCFMCGSEENLDCHHIISLYHIALGVQRLHNDLVTTKAYLLQLHENDEVGPAITFCRKCHQKKHPMAAKFYSDKPIAKEDLESWTFFYRNHNFKFAHTPHRETGMMGLLTLQTHLGINWHILNGYMDDRMLYFDPHDFAKLIGKRHGTSFMGSFEKSLQELIGFGHIADFSLINKHTCEVYVSQSYLRKTARNPWFISIEEIKTSRMLVLVLKILLSYYSGKQRVQMPVAKLQRLLNIHTRDYLKRHLAGVCQEISWASGKVEKGVAKFRLKKRSVVPIHSLRRFLTEQINQ